MIESSPSAAGCVLREATAGSKVRKLALAQIDRLLRPRAPPMICTCALGQAVQLRTGTPYPERSRDC